MAFFFRCMLTGRERSLVAARGRSETAKQIAVREMQIVRISSVSIVAGCGLAQAHDSRTSLP
jgi:hypothetical protein